MTAPTGDDGTPPPPVDAPNQVVVRSAAPHQLMAVVDLSLGAGALALTVASRITAVTGVIVRPLVDLVPRPPLPAVARVPGAFLTALTRRGARTRVQAGTDLDAASKDLVPALTDAVLDRLDLTELVLTRVDLARVVEGVLDRIDLTELVLDRVDLDRIIASADLDAAAAQLDVDAVAARLDVDAVASRLDVDAVAKRLDVDAVAARMDLVGIATYIVDAIDLPEIVRTSTGSVATEAVRGVRMQSVDADAQLQTVVDRVLLRRRARRTQAPADPDGSPS